MEFNNDKFIAEEFIKLKNEWNVDTIVETGTFQGETTEWFANNFNCTHSIEIETYNAVNLKILEIKYLGKLYVHFGSSPTVLQSLVPNFTKRTMFFLDAHWGDFWPLLDELSIIKNCKIKPIIAIHDFKCYNFGFDSYKGINLDYNYVKNNIEDIYGDSGYIFYTNSPDKITGCMRGVGYFIPKTKI